MKPRILVPFDFSETAEVALAWAAELQAATGAPPLEMVHAVSLRPVGTPELPVEYMPLSEEDARRLEQELKQAASQHHADAMAHVFVGAEEVGQLILDAARELRVDLVVMGTHGRTGVRRLFLGSVAEHVVRHADCPVVTVRGRR